MARSARPGGTPLRRFPRASQRLRTLTPLLLVASLLGACGGQKFSSNKEKKVRVVTLPPRTDDAKTAAGGENIPGANTGSNAGGENLPGGKDANGNPLPPGAKQTTEAFLSQVGKGSVDVVWTVDNSGSMSNEAAHVRTNLADFFSTIQSQRDMKVAVISQNVAGDGNYVALSDQDIAAGHRQVEAKVGSFDGLILAAAASCPTDQTVLNSKLCNVSMGTMGLQEPPARGLDVAKGRLADFFRPNAKRVYVFVTDDNSVVTSDQFLEAVSSTTGGTSPAVFSFAATPESRCPIGFSRSLQYITLASATQGEVFNLCETSWTAHFGKLTQEIISFSEVSYDLRNRTAQQIVSVTVDGKKITPDAYKLENNRVIIDKSLVPTAGLRVEIKYVYQ